LSDYGFPVACKHLGFTESHQVYLDYGDYEKGRVVAEKLQRANIIVDCAIRVGTCEITRRGMKEAEMDQIADLLKRIIHDEENPDRIKKEVAKLCADFQKTEFCFE
jgi:glycine hydroxymethyltransferase